MLETILSLFISFTAQNTNYDKVIQTLQQFEVQNPASSQVVTIGVNDQGVPIRALKIGSGPTASLVVATHHGNEYGSTAVAMAVAESLAKAPISNQTIYVLPVLNISGYNKRSRYENGINISVDPNRDYTGPCKRGNSFNLKSTKALADFIDSKNIQISATLHTYWPTVVYPWGISTTDLSTPHDEKYLELVKAATVESQYQVGNNTQILYPADGTFEDYAYWKHGIWSLLFELGFSHSPDPTAIKNMVDVNVPGIRRFLEVSPKLRADNHSFTGKCDSRMSQRVWLE
jgi:carboxypeptidase T